VLRRPTELAVIFGKVSASVLALHPISLPRAVNGSLTGAHFRTILNTLSHSTARILSRNAMAAISEKSWSGRKVPSYAAAGVGVNEKSSLLSQISLLLLQ
jgi:hypothetical protein